jgi:glycosyltransferase involved in cell wall biosynthesis
VRSVPLRRLLAGPAGPGRVFFHNIWFRGHNNPRYAELLPRLDRLDPYLLVCSDRRALRAIQFRSLMATRRLRYATVLSLAARRYRWMLTTAPEQIGYFRGPVVADVDDPTFTDGEAAALGRPNVAAYVVTAPRTGETYREMGVRAPWHVIPQGVDLSSLRPTDVAAVASRHRRPGRLAVGYVAAHLLTEADRGGENPLYDVDHLLDLWETIRGRVPHADLWLIGSPSKRLRWRLHGRTDVLLLGPVPRNRILAYIANFDVALYPRRQDQGIQAVKIAEYLGAGVATVSYDHRVTADLREAGAGLVVRTPAEFVEAVAALAADASLRRRLAAAARRAGAARDWGVLAARYREEILDRYLA